MATGGDRGLWHDVRGILAAAIANAEFVRSRELPEDLGPVLDEIEHEVRLVSDVIALVGSADPDQELELDLRALLLVARGRKGLRIDATQPSFTVRGPQRALDALATAIVAAADGTPAATVISEADACTLRGLDRKRASSLATATVVGDAGLVAAVEGDALVLRRND